MSSKFHVEGSRFEMQWNCGFLSLVVCLVALALPGCSSNGSKPEASAPPELTWDEQVVAVKAGTTDRLEITEATIDDTQLQQLAELSSLRELLLDKSNVTDAGVAHLTKLGKLEHLKLRGARITDAGFQQLCTIESLQRLNLPQADLTDAGLAAITNLKQLELLRLGSPKVTDAGVAHIAQAQTIRWLHLIDIPLGDASLKSIAELPHLESLYLDGAKMSDAAYDEFFKAKPKLHVHIDQKHHDRDPHGHSH
ncbi:hypothetical protein NA78x_000196 [Anatilimnocola sp. NA78]|uniref:hypothetical protein n=1 Tax=Anatilimnocola sp. NA78 TaxID=3415683 RepID=UPI003CE523BD